MGKAAHDPQPSCATRGHNLDRAATKVYLVGGGIASLAAAVFLIRDGDVLGQNITVMEGLGKLGGSLDGAGSPARRLRRPWRADAREQVSLHLRPVLVDPNP